MLRLKPPAMERILSRRSILCLTKRINGRTARNPAVSRPRCAVRSFHSCYTGNSSSHYHIFKNDDYTGSFQYGSTSIRRLHKVEGASTRDMADLEDRIYSVVGSSVKDPEIKTDLKSLGWLNRRIAVSENGTIQILLRLPTLLHPGLEELKTLVKAAAETEIKDWANGKGIKTDAIANVEAIATKPVSWLVKDEEDQKELESRLGPGLANVAHVIGVYSCKVSNGSLYLGRFGFVPTSQVIFQIMTFEGWRWKVNSGSKSCV